MKSKKKRPELRQRHPNTKRFDSKKNERDIEIFETVLNNNGIFVHLTCKLIRPN